MFCLGTAKKILKTVPCTYSLSVHTDLAVPHSYIMSVNMRGQMEDVSSLNTLLALNIFPSSFSFARTARHYV